MTKLIVLGETYHGRHLEKIKEILKEEKNINGIFIEKPINYQTSVDNYIANEVVDEMLDRHYEGARKEGKNIKDTDLFLFNLARIKNIPVICIDSSKIRTDRLDKKSEHGYYFLKGESRDEDMYLNIKNNIKDNETWILLCGSAHLSSNKHHRTGKKTLGSWLKENFEDLKINILEQG